MTVKELIDHVDKIRPNKFDFETKLLWINQVEAKCQSEILRVSVQSIKLLEGEDDTLTVPFAYIAAYVYYVMAMMDIFGGEFEKYNLSSAAYNAEIKNYAKWVARGAK